MVEDLYWRHNKTVKEIAQKSGGSIVWIAKLQTQLQLDRLRFIKPQHQAGLIKLRI